MKKVFGKRFHRIPVALVSVLLVAVLMTGGAFAAFGFFTGTLNVGVVEAIAVGMGTWDNLEPYGSVDDVEITLSGTLENPVLTITTAAETPFVGEGFCPGEWIVIPLNIRNGSDGALTLTASASSAVLDLSASFELNNGAETDPIPAGHEGDFLSYIFKADDDLFTALDGWVATVEGNSGFSGSAVHNAQVLFVKISAPGDMEPGEYTSTITLGRS